MNDLYEDEMEMELDGFDYEDEYEGFGDFEMEAEADWEGDFMDMEGDMEDSIMEMEMLAESALEADNEEEADEFIGLLGSLAASLLPKAIPLVTKFIPKIARGISSFFGKKRHSPIGRKMIRIAPQVIRNVARGAARRYGHGRPITPGWVLKNIANQTYRAARNPMICRRALRNHYRYVRRAQNRPRYGWRAAGHNPNYGYRRSSRYYGMPSVVH